MKVKEKYDMLKKEKSDFLVLFKVGSFYTTYGNDALLLNYLFSYQIKNDKLGFPISALNKVLFELEQKKISYLIVSDEENHEKCFDDNQYFSYLNLTQEFYYHKMSMDLLFQRIELLIHKDPDNYSKIKRFIDGL